MRYGKNDDPEIPEMVPLKWNDHENTSFFLVLSIIVIVYFQFSSYTKYSFL